MQYLLSYALGWILIMICQIIIVPRITIFGIYPDIALITIILWALKQGWKAGIWYGFALGASFGLWRPELLGWMILLMSLIGYLIGLVREGIYLDSAYFQFFTGLFATFIFQIALRFVQGPSIFIDNILLTLRDSLLVAIYTAAVGMIGLWMVRERYRIRNLI